MTTSAASPPPDSPTSAVTLTDAGRRLLAGVAGCLGLVILAPIILSGQDLYSWARAVRGLNLAPGFAVMVPVALDIAAAACIGMVVIGAVWRRERAGIFGLLIWVFAGVSAYAQYSHGHAEQLAGRSQDGWWLFPALALLGPTLLDVTLQRVRRWAREDKQEQLRGAAGFGARWLPGVAFRETLAAWAASRREGIGRAADAIAYVRERAALAELAPADAVLYAYAALGHRDPYAVRVWLQARGVLVDQGAIDAAARLAPVELHQAPALDGDQAPAEVEPAPVPARPALPAAEVDQLDQAPALDGDQGAEVRAVAPMSPAVPADLSTVNKSTAVAYAYLALGADATAARVIEWCQHRGVSPSERLVYKVRANLPAWTESTGELPLYVPADLAPINGHSTELAASLTT